jgi:hypothetical protein
VTARPDGAELLRTAAAGRREYATSLEGATGTLGAQREALLAQAGVLDQAAKVVEGDLGPMYGWLPSWRWTDEMNERIDEDFTASPPRVARRRGRT